jgi:glycosyltransferase involved in cell wall biosynthesis
VKSLNEINSENIKVTELPENYGKGHCLRVGVRASESKYVAFLDADLDIDPGSILLGLEVLEKCDDGSIGCVYGSKFHPSSTLSYPPLRKVASKVFKITVQTLFGLNIDDSQTGLKLFRNSDLQRVINDTKENRFMFDLEVMILLNRNGVKMSPIPVNLNYRYSSTIGLKSVMVLGAQTAGLFFRQSIKRK